MPNWCYNEVTLESEDKPAMVKFLMNTIVGSLYEPSKAPKDDKAVKKHWQGHFTERQQKAAFKVVSDDLESKTMTSGEAHVLTLHRLIPDWREFIDEHGDWLVEKSCPMPAGKENDVTTYDWMCTNTGTKWNPFDCYYQISKVTKGKRDVYQIYLGFDSAWSPPIQAFRRFCEEHPSVKLRHRYKEEGMGYRGTFWMTKGKVTRDYYSD